MGENMKKKGMLVSVCMSITISLCLSLFGTLTSGHFTVKGWLISFAVTTVLSIIIGLVVPHRKISAGICDKHNIKQPFKKLLIESAVSDLIYTIPLTIVSVLMATAHAPVPIVPIIIKSLITSLIFGYFVIMIFQPLFVRLIINPPKEKNEA